MTKSTCCDFVLPPRNSAILVEVAHNTSGTSCISISKRPEITATASRRFTMYTLCVGSMTRGVIEDGNIQVDVYEDKLHVSLSDEPVKGLEMSGLDGHPLQSRVDQLFRQYRSVFSTGDDVPGR